MSIRAVTFRWDDRHGDCRDDGNPAAFRLVDMPEILLCALCAANHAADGDPIEWIENPYAEPTEGK